MWVVASIGFSLYTSRFGSYGETYGSLGAVVVLMLWLLLSAVAIILGAEINAEAERQTRRDSTDPPRGRSASGAPTPPTRSGRRRGGAVTEEDRPTDGPGQGYVPDQAHRRPKGASDALVEAMGKVSEAWEWIERMRGRLYDLHQMAGHADFLFGDAAEALREAGCAEAAEAVEHEVVGRNVLDGRWTFQMVEEFDDQYYEPVRALERRAPRRADGGQAPRVRGRAQGAAPLAIPPTRAGRPPRAARTADAHPRPPPGTGAGPCPSVGARARA